LVKGKPLTFLSLRMCEYIHTQSERTTMPTKESKQQVVAKLQDSFGRAKLAVVADYRGLSVAEITDLRRRVQAAGGDVTVAKNTLVKVATNGNETWTSLNDVLAGPTAIVFGYDDVAGPAKALYDFSKEKRAVKVAVRGAVMEGAFLDTKKFEAVASLPSREVLLTQLVSVLMGPLRGLAIGLDAVRQQKEEASA
jgi:large subunit ribosomal protein L10